MKRRWKIFFIADGIILALGIMICLVGWIVGDKPEYSGLHILDGEWNVKNFGLLYDGDTGEVIDGNDDVLIDAVELSCKMGELTIEGVSSANGVTVSGGGLHTDLEIKEKNGKRVLMVKDGKSSFGELNICLPQDKKLDYIKTSVGAGELELENLTAKELNVKVGTGDASLHNVTADNAVLECGMGDMDFEHSVLGMRDFNYDLSCKAGEIKIGEAEYSGLNFSEKIENGGGRNMKISCKMGDVSLEFANDGRTEDDYAEDYEDTELHEEHKTHGKGDF